MPRSIHTDVLCDVSAFEALSGEWAELLERSDAGSPMVTPTWLLGWWRVFGADGGRELRVVTLRESGRLVGLLPLLARRIWYGGLLPFRRVELVGSGEDEEDEILSEYIGPIVERGREAELAPLLAEAIASRVGAWDELVLPAMDGTQVLPAELERALSGIGEAARLETVSEAPFAALPGSFDGYLKSLPSSHRYKVSRALRDFEAFAAGGAEVHVASDAASLAEGQRVLAELHAERWSAEGRPSLFSSARFSSFHRLVMPRLLDLGVLDLSWVSVRGEPIAAAYSLVHAGRLHFYQSGRKVDVPKGVRPGIVMHARAIARSIDRGLEAYDFLGGASQYKRMMATGTRPIVSLRAVRPSLRDGLRRLAGAAGPVLRPALQRAASRLPIQLPGFSPQLSARSSGEVTSGEPAPPSRSSGEPEGPGP